MQAVDAVYDAKVADAKVQIRNLETALKLYKLDTGTFPSTDQGLQALKEESLVRAEQIFTEISKIDDTDAMTQKNLRLIKRYKDTNKDLLFRTYIKYLKPR